MKEINIGVHETHCCVLHGCKYGSENCPVKNGKIIQQYPCPDCSNEEGIESVKALYAMMELGLRKCPHCGSYYTPEEDKE